MNADADRARPQAWQAAVRRGGPWALLAAAAVVAFYPGLTYDLLQGFDDDVYVLKNSSRLTWSWANLRHWWTQAHVGNYHPLTMMSYMVDRLLWPSWGPGYHLQNLFWHVLAVGIFFRLLRAFRLPEGRALLLALIFCVHPQRVESVVWVAERKDVLCAAFYLAAVVAWVVPRQQGLDPRWCVVTLLAVAALLAKAMAVSLPFVLLCYEVHRHRGLPTRRYVTRLLPTLAATLAGMPVAMAAQAGAIRRSPTLLDRLTVVAHNLWWYVRTALLPYDLNPSYPRIAVDAALVVELAAVAVVAAGVGFWLWRRRRDRLYYDVLPAAAAYVVVLAPVAGFVPLGAIDHADRYSYLPSAVLWLGVGLLVVAGVGLWRQRSAASAVTARLRRLLTAAAAVYLVGLMVAANYHARIWQNMYTLLQTATAARPANTHALAAFLDLQVWRREYAAAAELAARLEARGAPVLAAAGRGKILYRAGRKRRALPHLKAAADHRQRLAPLVANNVVIMLSDCLLAQQQQEAAAAWYRRINPALVTEEFRPAAARLDRVFAERPADSR